MRQNDNALRIARQSAAYRLTVMGIKPPAGTCQRFVEFIERETGFKIQQGEGVLSYLARFNASKIRPVNNPRIAEPRYRPPFREYKPTPHLRQAEIDRHPRQISIGGVGNGSEYSKVWTR